MIIVEMTNAECLSELAGASYGRLACALDGQPYIVPIYFVLEGEIAYSFALPGQKIEWMRGNPRVCLEIDTVTGGGDWTSVVALGRFKELSDTPEDEPERAHALELLQRRPMWWQPGATSAESVDEKRSHEPIFYRITFERLTGHRGVPDPRQGHAQGDDAPK
jgi:uncharacterized protein